MILITGSKGYIGRNFTLESNKPIITRVDKEIDITEIHKIKEKIEGIVHFAAVSRVKWCEKDPVQAMKVNVAGMIAVLELARKNKAWVVFTSSLEAENKKNLYGLSKFFAEELCRYYSTRYNLYITIVVLPDVIGRDNHKDKAIPKLRTRIKAGKDVVITNPEQLFKMVYIDTVDRTLKDIVDDLKRTHKSKSKIIIKE